MKKTSLSKRLLSMTASLALAVTSAPLMLADAAGTRVGVHDPSIVKLDDGSYYIIGSHLAGARSADLMNWTMTANSDQGTKNTTYFKDIYTDLAKPMAWSNTSTNYDLSGNLWAPDIVWNPNMNKWCMYLSVNGDDWHSSIVMCTADNIDGPYTYVDTIVYSGFETNPANPANSYKNTDVEKVLGSNPDLSRYLTSAGRWNAEYGTNAIDAGVFYDEAGNLWMVYGSWFGGIFMLQLDENTGLRDYTVTYPTTSTNGAVQSDAYLGKHVAGGHWASGEGPYIEYMCPEGSSKGYYYMFLSYGYFNNKGGYNMRIFRSENPDGPYVDENGNSAIYSTVTGDSNTAGNIGERLMSNYQWSCNDRPNTAQGHNSALMDDDGNLYVIYHNKFDDQWGFHEVRVHQLIVNEDGWITAAPYEYTKGDKLSESGHTMEAVTGDYELIWHNPNQKFVNEKSADVEKPINITLNADGTVTGDISATWEMKDGTPYMSFTWGGVTYKGAFIVNNDESAESVRKMCFTATGINICIWGSKKTAYDINEDMGAVNTSSQLVYTADPQAPDSSVYLADTDLLADVSYKITSRFNGLSLDVYGGRTEDGANVQQWGYTSGKSNEEWRICNAGNGYVKIFSMKDESFALTANNGNIEIAKYTGADNQLFKLVQKRGSYGIVSKSSGDKSGLDVFEWSEEAGGNIAEYEYWGGDCQLWNLTPTRANVTDGNYVIKSVNSGNFLSLDSNNSVIQDSTPTVWSISNNANNYEISAENGTMGFATAENGTDVALVNNSSAFSIYANADGSYAITDSGNNHKSLDVYGISKDAGANICLWDYWGGDGQKWVLVPAKSVEIEEPATEPTAETPTTEPTEPVTEPATETKTPDYGDVDCDGDVDIVDVLTLNQYLVGIDGIKPDGEKNADVDTDKQITDADAMNILKSLVKLVTLPIQK